MCSVLLFSFAYNCCCLLEDKDIFKKHSLTICQTLLVNVILIWNLIFVNGCVSPQSALIESPFSGRRPLLTTLPPPQIDLLAIIAYLWCIIIHITSRSPPCVGFTTEFVRIATNKFTTVMVWHHDSVHLVATVCDSVPTFLPTEYIFQHKLNKKARLGLIKSLLLSYRRCGFKHFHVDGLSSFFITESENFLFMLLTVSYAYFVREWIGDKISNPLLSDKSHLHLISTFAFRLFVSLPEPQRLHS